MHWTPQSAKLFAVDLAVVNLTKNMQWDMHMAN